MSMRRSPLLPALGLACLVAACHKTVPAPAVTAPTPPPAVVPAPPPPAPPPPSASATPAPAPRPLTDDEVFARKSIDDLNREHPLADAYFDLDRADIRNDARTALQRDADWLNRWTSVAVTVQGQCDERGSPEYNLALGNRRASSVKEYLSSLGLPISRVTTVSLGKESPVCTEHDETCWQQNRRGHFVITAK